RRGDREPRSRRSRGVRAHGQPPARRGDGALHSAPSPREPGCRYDRAARAPRPAGRRIVAARIAVKKLPTRADFLPEILALQEQPPSPLPRAVLWSVLALIGSLAIWASVGKLDVVAVAEGRLVPKSQLRIVQPAEGGVMRELLVKEGERVREGQVLA